jgi:transglutaminase-like putative cysteine protease
MNKTLEVTHETRYAYSAPVTLAHHLAHLEPLRDAVQALHQHALVIEPAPAHKVDSVDSMGNRQRHFSLLQPHDELLVRAISTVRVTNRFAALQPESGPRCGELAASLRYVSGGPLNEHFLPAVEYVQPSPYVPRLPALRAYGAASLTTQRAVAAAAMDLMQRIHTDFTYQSQSTAVDTPLARVFETRRGVCQDFAHLMAATLRLAGLPARYVSGYLLTHAPAGDNNAGQAMQGADASHAWVQVWCPGTEGVGPDGWLDLDPTNNVVPGSGHVRLAVGRDFGDVTPLRGVIRGGGHHTLTVAVRTRLLPPQAQPLLQ